MHGIVNIQEGSRRAPRPPGLELGLSGETLHSVFPFHLAVNRDLEVVQVGAGLARLTPPLLGTPFLDAFEVRRPTGVYSFESMVRNRTEQFLVETMLSDQRAVLKGQIVPVEEMLVLLSSPWVTSIEDLERLGLGVDDLPIHSPSGDYLSLLRVQTRARERMEKELRHAQRLESLGILAAGAAHEFNNMLTPMICLAEIVRDTLPEDDPSREDLAAVLEAGARAGALVEKMLTFGRSAETDADRVDLTNLVRGVIQLLRATVPTTIRISCDLPQEAVLIHAEATQLNQVLLNLGSNARHAIGGDAGEISFTVERLESDWAPGGGAARIIVSDTGCGISADAIRRVFDPFFTTKEVGEGTGMGLSIVHGIITNLAGRISVDSEVGVGTSFTIELPVLPEGSSQH